MSDPVEEPKRLVSISLELPSGLLDAYDELVESGIHPDRESALLHGLVETWRQHRGSYHTIRLDLLNQPGPGDPPDTAAEAASNDDASGESGI
ncbi:hypothetical protein [Rhodobacteraceae bacterium DSL-40]|uniref:hypothetical protein n=1 Tax=Amaricoccus sp. B4 TaxID=3368557 RepID=UPI000DACFFE2